MIKPGDTVQFTDGPNLLVGIVDLIWNGKQDQKVYVVETWYGRKTATTVELVK